MAGRRTNLALLVLLIVALATGALGFAVGTAWVRWVLVAHAAAGLAMVLLAPWKSAIARRGLRRPRSGRAASVALAVLVVVATVTGILHSTGLGGSLGPVSSMQVHVGSALLAVPLAVWHVAARRVRLRRTDLSRRTLLRAGALTGGAVAATVALEGVVTLAGLPGGRRRFTGSLEAGSGRPEAMPVTQWLDDRVPPVDPATWRLAVRDGDGSVRTVTVDELDGHGDTLVATLDCTGGWFAEQEWAGARLDRVVDLTGARSVLIRSATGYARRLPAGDAARLLLATRAAGRPLDPGHGAPVRLVAPGRRGFWWVKWVTTVEGGTTPWWWQPPFPLT